MGKPCEFADSGCPSATGWCKGAIEYRDNPEDCIRLIILSYKHLHDIYDKVINDYVLFINRVKCDISDQTHHLEAMNETLRDVLRREVHTP